MVVLPDPATPITTIKGFSNARHTILENTRRRQIPTLRPERGAFCVGADTIVPASKAQPKTGGNGGKMRAQIVLIAGFLGMAGQLPRPVPSNTAMFGTTKDGATVHIVTLTNNHGMRAQVLDYGGIVCDVEAPGRDGKMANVILCQKDLAGIEATGR